MLRSFFELTVFPIQQKSIEETVKLAKAWVDTLKSVVVTKQQNKLLMERDILAKEYEINRKLQRTLRIWRLRNQNSANLSKCLT